ncbi:hypothetical protein M988_4314 [Hafnia paralvei ATCC 29927]|uniref:DUF4942 domain-containing protein n=1 Tax=Hafnia paralvei TaxID=546367 RepID=UPI0007F47FCF|nr:hypothetical protein M988_4314 [Hafnia paralvei ATCC 29927]
MQNTVLSLHHGVTDSIYMDSSTEQAGGLIPSVEIDRIISIRAEGLKKYADGLAMLHDAKALFLSVSGDLSTVNFGQCVFDAVRWESNPKRDDKVIKKGIDVDIWQYLMNETGMITLMSSKQQDAWEKQLHSDDMPEITLETVIATFTQLNASKSDTFEQGVIDVFRALSWDYKTNNPCRLGKKIIVSRLLETWGKGYTKATCSSVAKLDDLAKPFYVLEGKPVPDYRVADGANFTLFYDNHGFSGEVYEGEYFFVKYHKNGNGHIVFKRPELVDKINDIVSRRYPDMLPERV